MPKISTYTASSPTDIDQFITARTGANKSITGTKMGSGWIEVSETWAYASATTITIPTDGTTKYQKGMKIRFKQGGGYKYFYGVGVAATLLTVTGGSDYSVANAAITDVAYSFIENPFGFPDWFNWTPAITGYSVNPSNVVYRFKIQGKSCRVSMNEATLGTASSADRNYSAPVTAKTVTNATWSGTIQSVDNNILGASGFCQISSGASTIFMFRSAAAAWTASGSARIANAELEYEI